MKQIIQPPMRYEQFLYDEETEGTMYVHDPNQEGLVVITKSPSEAEQMVFRGQVRLMEGIYSTVCELFEITNLHLETTGQWHSFFVRQEGTDESETGVNSPKLSRAKLTASDPHTISGAIIDLIRERHTWTDRRSYVRFHM